MKSVTNEATAPHYAVQARLCQVGRERHERRTGPGRTGSRTACLASSVAVMDDAYLRVSDDDREQAVAALREHLLAGRPDAPEVHVRVLGFAGTIDVWRVPRDLHGSSFDDIVRRLHDRRRQLPA